MLTRDLPGLRRVRRPPSGRLGVRRRLLLHASAGTAMASRKTGRPFLRRVLASLPRHDLSTAARQPPPVRMPCRRQKDARPESENTDWNGRGFGGSVDEGNRLRRAGFRASADIVNAAMGELTRALIVYHISRYHLQVAVVRRHPSLVSSVGVNALPLRLLELCLRSSHRVSLCDDTSKTCFMDSTRRPFLLLSHYTRKSGSLPVLLLPLQQCLRSHSVYLAALLR